ncbi:MAG: hypothetical protein R3E68_14040 [Burkholderiaceae bacterium]
MRTRLDSLHAVIVPDSVLRISISRDYGQTAADKAAKLIRNWCSRPCR